MDCASISLGIQKHKEHEVPSWALNTCTVCRNAQCRLFFIWNNIATV